MAGPNNLTKKVQKSDVLKPTKNNLIKKGQYYYYNIYIALWMKSAVKIAHNPIKGWIGLPNRSFVYLASSFECNGIKKM